MHFVTVPTIQIILNTGDFLLEQAVVTGKNCHFCFHQQHFQGTHFRLYIFLSEIGGKERHSDTNIFSNLGKGKYTQV